MATMPSPPGRFSTTTGWPHFAESLSANSRAPMSTPLPGPSVMMNLTGRLGQASAAALGCDNNGDTRKSAAARIKNAQTGFAGLLMDPPGAGRPFVVMAVAARSEITPAKPSASAGYSASLTSRRRYCLVVAGHLPRNCRLHVRGCAVDSRPELTMPSFLLSPFVKWSLAALGGAMVVHWAVKEARRINEELDQARRVKARITDAENRPTLRRDPR